MAAFSASDRWQYFNVSRLFDQAELEKAYNQCAQPSVPVATALVPESLNSDATPPQLADVMQTPSSLSILLSSNILKNSAKQTNVAGPLGLFSTHVSTSTESVEPVAIEKDVSSFDISQFSGLLSFEESDRQSLCTSVQNKVMSSCVPKNPSSLQKRVLVLEKIHEALETYKQGPIQTSSELKDADLPSKLSSAKTKPFELSPAVDLAMNAFLSFRDRLDLTDPSLCRNLIATLQSLFSNAFSSKLDISNESPMISAVISFLQESISNSKLDDHTRSQALEILFQLYVGQASVSGILGIVELLFSSKGLQFCNLNLAAPLQELAGLIYSTSNAGMSPELHSFGRGDTGRLGQGTANTSVQVPQVIETLRGKKIVNIATFSTHSLAVSDSGDVYAWGNGQHGRLGTKSLANAPTPIQLKPIIGHRIISVAVGLSHSVLLSDQGRVFSFGNGVNGRLGTGDTKERRVPTMIQSLVQYSVIGIACGSAFTFALVEGGSLFSWGKNTTGQCGHGNLSECQTPKRISALANDTIVHVAGGWDHALACSSRGVVYSWGCGYEGTRPVLGNGTKTRQHTPIPIETLYGHNIVKVAAGYDHSLAICDNGDVYAWGSSAVGQLGLGDTQERLFPEKIQALSGQVITSADGGMDHTLFITSDGDVYACGNGAESALGIACSGPLKRPQLVEELKGKYIKKVACGDKCSIVLSTSRLDDSSATSTRPLKPQDVIRTPGITMQMTEKLTSVDWRQIVVYSMAILDMSSGSFAPHDNFLWDETSAKLYRDFERFAIDLQAKTFEHIANILEVLDSYHLDAAQFSSASSISEGRSEDSSETLNAEEVFIPFVLVAVLRVLKIHIWQIIRANSQSCNPKCIDCTSTVSQRLQQSIVALMNLEQNRFSKPDWTNYIKQEAAEIFVLGIELWFPNHELYSELLNEVISGSILSRLPDQYPFGVSIQDALMKRLSEPLLLSNFLQSNHEFGDNLVTILLQLIQSVLKSSFRAQKESEKSLVVVDRKDSGTNPDVSFTWVRSPLNHIQKLTSRPGVSSNIRQRGDVALLIAFQQALLNQIFLERPKDSSKLMLTPFPSHQLLIKYSSELIDHCCMVMESSGNVFPQDSVVECVLPIFITSLHCFTKNALLGCALLDKLKKLCQRIEQAQLQFASSFNASLLIDLEISAIDLCGQFLTTLLEANSNELDSLEKNPDLSQFLHRYGPSSTTSSSSMQICAMRYFVELIPLVLSFFAMDAVLKSMVQKVVNLQVDPKDWELATIMETLFHLLMGLPHRSHLTVVQQQAITIRVLPYLTSDFVVKSCKMHTELGLLTFLRDCIWRIQYGQSSDSELSLILHEVHRLAVRVLQSIVLQSDDIFHSALEALFQELSSAASWSLTTSALKPSKSDVQASSLQATAITLIGLSQCLTSECIELPNICREQMADFSLSLWLWLSLDCPALVLQFKGHAAFFSISIDHVLVRIGATEVRHDSVLEPNQWTLFTITVKNRQLKLFVDDSLSNQQTAVSAFPAFPTDVPLQLSGSVGNRICALRWWNEALSSEHVAEMYQEGPHRIADVKEQGSIAKSTSQDSVPYEYLCMLNCMACVSGTIRNSLEPKWSPILVTLLNHGTVRMKIVILRTIANLLQEKQLVELEPLLWPMCTQSWVFTEDNISRPEDDNACIQQESIGLYRRLLDCQGMYNLFLSRLRQCVSELLKNDDINVDCLTALSILGGSFPVITTGSNIVTPSGVEGIITSIEPKTGTCFILISTDVQHSSEQKKTKRFVLRQELLSKCLPAERPCNVKWTADLVAVLAPLILKSVAVLQELLASDGLSSKRNIFWCNVANQSFSCLSQFLSHPLASADLIAINTLQSSGIIKEIVSLASQALPLSIQPKFRSSNNLAAFVRSILSRERPAESRANLIVGSGRRSIIPVQIVSSLESLGLIPLRSAATPLIPNPDPNMASYKCPGCSQQDLTMPILLVHFQKHHAKSPMRAECPLCSSSSRAIPGTFHPSIESHFRRCHKALAANGSDLPVSTVSQDSVAKLMAMGFEVDHCIYALEQSNEDLVAATNWILNNLSTVGALVEAKKAAAAAAAAASSSQASSDDLTIDENNSYESSRKQANEDIEASNDFLELDCGSVSSSSVDLKASSSSLSANTSSYFHSLVELTMMAARNLYVSWLALDRPIVAEPSAFLRIIKLTLFRGQTYLSDARKAEIFLQCIKQHVDEELALCLIEDVLQQISLALSPTTGCLYEEVSWGARITDCTDTQAVDEMRLCLERAFFMIQLDIIPQIVAKGADLILAALYNPNVHVKALVFKLLADPSAQTVDVPIDRLCLLLSRCLIEEHAKKQTEHSAFTSALLQLCLSRAKLPVNAPSEPVQPSMLDLGFDDMSPLKVSEDGTSAVHMMDGVWLSAICKQSIRVANISTPYSSSESQICFAFTIDSMTNRMISFGFTTDPNEVSCSWVGASQGTWGIVADGSIWFSGKRILQLGLSFESSDVIGFVVDLNCGTVSLFRNEAALGQVFRGLSQTVYPCVSLFHQSNSVSLKKGWKSPDPSFFPLDLESAAGYQPIRASIASQNP